METVSWEQVGKQAKELPTPARVARFRGWRMMICKTARRPAGIP